jgi:Reverse transcriptase (RNA-dependent DNA polymerase)
MCQNRRSGSDSRRQLDLYSLRHLEVLLRLGRKELRELATHAGRFYAPFPKTPKARPFPKKSIESAKVRLIDNPIEPLKSVQDKIHLRLLKELVLPEHLLGGMPGKTIKHNIFLHAGSRVLVTIDIKSFFPSISARKIFQVWRDFLNCSREIANTLTKLTTRNGHLPQGAPTSTLLANLVLASLDQPIRAGCAGKAVIYSSWVDDLAFSGNDDARQIMTLVISTLNRSGFSVKHKKIRVMGAGSKKLLNKILLNKTPSVGRERLDQIRSGIHKLTTGEVAPKERATYLSSLRGKIAFVRQFNPAKASALEQRLDAALRPKPPTRTSSVM